MSTNTTFESICTELGMDPEAVVDSADRVESMIETIESEREIETTRQYGDVTVHLHQLIETDADPWVVVGLQEDAVRLASTNFERETYAYGSELGDRYHPQTTTVDGQEIPRFAY